MRVFLLLLAALPVMAEMNWEANPSFVDRMEAVRINPALAAWQPLAFSADWEALYPGLLASPVALNQGGVHVTLPRYNLALLIDHRDTELLAESELMVDWAWRPLGNMSLGLELGLRHFSWNRDLLGDELLQDPVFSAGTSRWQPLLGLGAYWSPATGVHAAVSLKRLNQPSLALSGDEARAPVRFHSGVSWRGDHLRVGFSIDNLRHVSDNHDWAEAFNSQLELSNFGWRLPLWLPRVAMKALDVKPSLQVGWRALDDLEVMMRLRQGGLSFDADLKLAGGHEIGYLWDLPLGDVLEYSRGSHMLRYRYSLGGALVPGGLRPGAPRTLPADRRSASDFANRFGRRWKPEETPIQLRSMASHLELLELHVEVSERLAKVLEAEGHNPLDLAMAGVIQGGRQIDPTRSGVVEETYSPAWWQLAGLIEELAWDQGLDPVIHVGEESLRATQLANLLGAPLELPGGGALSLPSGSRLLLPDTLSVRCELEPEIERLCGDWSLSLELPGGARAESGGRGVPPALLQLALPSVELERGYAILTLDVNDEDERLMIHRVMELPVLLRVRNTHLDLGDDVDVDDVDSIHLHLSK